MCLEHPLPRSNLAWKPRRRQGASRLLQGRPESHPIRQVERKEKRLSFTTNHNFAQWQSLLRISITISSIRSFSKKSTLEVPKNFSVISCLYSYYSKLIFWSTASVEKNEADCYWLLQSALPVCLSRCKSRLLKVTTLPKTSSIQYYHDKVILLLILFFSEMISFW